MTDSPEFASCSPDDPLVRAAELRAGGALCATIGCSRPAPPSGTKPPGTLAKTPATAAAPK